MNEYEGSILLTSCLSLYCKTADRNDSTGLLVLHTYSDSCFKTSESPSHIPGVEHTGSESVAAEV